MKYIDADRLKELLDAKYKEFTEKAKKDCPLQYQYMADGLDIAEQFVDSLQQDKETLELCSKIWWEEQGWIMIPPNATIKGIDSLLKQVRKKLQQEQPEVDLEKDIADYWTATEWCQIITLSKFKVIARYFYGLGLNAKEEQK